MDVLNKDYFLNMYNSFNTLFPPYKGIEIIESTMCVKQNGYRKEKIKKSWKERLFKKPFKFWIKYREIDVENYEPEMYLVGNQLICHPSLVLNLENAIEKYNKTNVLS
jgi:hypothetical protein